MRYGKIRIEDGNLVFTKHMMVNSLPCSDIVWAYMRREGTDGGGQKQLLVNYLVIITRREKKYKFDMTEKEVHDCIQLLRVLNPDMAVGFPRGARIPLQSLPNTRDLGAVMTKDGRHIIPRKLIRSGDLYHVSVADQQTLIEEYRLRTVIDFRTSAERAHKPDTLMGGVKYYHIPVLDEETMGISRGEGSIAQMLLDLDGDPGTYMEKQYENFILDPFSVKQYARFLDVILRQERGAVLWHCSAGKDRVGVATALLLYILGVPRKTIREDFMRTNEYTQEELAYMLRYLEAKGMVNEKIVENLNVFFSVKQSYITKVFRTIEDEYGTIDRFVRKALYLTPKMVEEIREKYLI